MAGMRPLRSAVSRNSCEARTPNSCVGRRISTSTMSGCPLVDSSSRRETMGCRCSANSSSRSAASISASRCCSRPNASISQARPSSGASPTKRSAAMIVVSEVSASGRWRFEHLHFARQLVDGLGQHRQHRREFQHAHRAVLFAGGQARERDQHDTAKLPAFENSQGHNVRGRYLRSPTTGRSFARARHADLRLPLRSARSPPGAGSRHSTRARCPALSWIDRERISGCRRMRPRASGASSEAGVSWVVGWLRHRWPQIRGARKRHRRRSVAT